MNSTELPSLRAMLELRQKAQSVLRPDETLTRFMIDAVNDQIEFRLAKADFLARGLASAAHADDSGAYVTGASVIDQLETKLTQSRARAQLLID